MKQPVYPDPDRPLVASQDFIGRFTANLAPADPYAVGPVWLLVHLLSSHLHVRQGFGPQDRIALYRDACTLLLEHTHEGTGSEPERHIHRTLAIFATCLGVRNA